MPAHLSREACGAYVYLVTSAVWTALYIPMDKILIKVTIFRIHLKFARYTGYNSSTHEIEGSTSLWRAYYG